MKGYSRKNLIEMGINLESLEYYGRCTNEILGHYKGFAKGLYWFSHF